MGFETGRRSLGGVRSSYTYLIACMSLGSLITADKKKSYPKEKEIPIYFVVPGLSKTKSFLRN